MDVKAILIWVAIGILAGWLASVVVGGGGFLGSLVVGLVGALVGGELAHLLNLNVTGGLLDRLIIAVLGAILFLFVWKKVFK